MLAQQNNILKLLGYDEQESSLDLSRHKLNSVLHGKRCLFIIDDIWDSRHLKCFDLSGTACRFLLTSRKADVLDRLGMERKRIDLLSEEQALAMLAQYADCSPADLPKEAAEIVKKCSFLPLAVAAVGSMVKGKPADRWQLALRKLQEAKLDKIFCKFDYQYENLFRALQVSVEALPEAQQQYYKTLAVFPEDELIPESVVVMYWEYFAFSDDAPQDVIDALVDASLLIRVDNYSLRLHDLLRDYLISQTEDIAALHKQLLEAYKAKYPGGWHMISYQDNAYFYRYWMNRTRMSNDSNLLSIIANDLIMRQPQLSYTESLNILEVSDCFINEIMFQIMKAKYRSYIFSSSFELPENASKMNLRRWMKENTIPYDGIDEVNEDARRLLDSCNDEWLLVNCIRILGNEAETTAKQLIKNGKDRLVRQACQELLFSWKDTLGSMFPELAHWKKNDADELKE